MITLFSYMQGVKKPSLGFVKELRAGVEKYFPDFEKNRYYIERTGAEEKRLIAMQGKSAFRFYWYYRAQLLKRRWAARGHARNGEKCER